jgi:hypothetical protein
MEKIAYSRYYFLFTALLLAGLTPLAAQQDTARTLASYDIDLNLNRESVSIWIPREEGWLLLAKPPQRDIHLLQTGLDFQLQQHWTFENGSYLREFRYLGHVIKGDTFSLYTYEKAANQIEIFQQNLATGEQAYNEYKLEDAYHESSLYIHVGEESCGLLRFYKKGRKQELRYYRFNGGLDYELRSLDVWDKGLGKALDELKDWMEVSEDEYGLNPYWNAMHAVSASWQADVLRLALDLPKERVTRLFKFDFGQSEAAAKHDIPFPAGDYKDQQISSRLNNEYLYRVAYQPLGKVIMLEGYEVESREKVWEKSLQAEGLYGMQDQGLYVRRLQANTPAQLLPDAATFFKKVKRYKHMFVCTAPTVDGRSAILFGASTDENRISLGGTILASALGSLVLGALGTGLTYGAYLTRPVEVAWAASAYDPATGAWTQGKVELLPRPAPRLFFGDKVVRMRRGNNEYLAYFDKQAERYVVKGR